VGIVRHCRAENEEGTTWKRKEPTIGEEERRAAGTFYRGKKTKEIYTTRQPPSTRVDVMKRQKKITN